MQRGKQEDAVREAVDQLLYRFPNLMATEDIWTQDLKFDDHGRPYGEIYRCTAPDGPKLLGKVFANGSLAIEIDMLSMNEFERVMIALWGNHDDKPREQYVFTVGARPKPTKQRSKAPPKPAKQERKK